MVLLADRHNHLVAFVPFQRPRQELPRTIAVRLPISCGPKSPPAVAR